jgi:hypothetical protein
MASDDEDGEVFGMKDSELQFDRTCHVLYSKACKKQIRAKIALHYPQNARERVWEQVQQQAAGKTFTTAQAEPTTALPS